MGGVVKKVGKTVGKVFGFDADAAREAAEQTAAANREAAEATRTTSEAQIAAQTQAARQSAQQQQRSLESQQALSKAQEQALANADSATQAPDVTIGGVADEEGEVDGASRRRKVRDQFQGGGSGIRIA